MVLVVMMVMVVMVMVAMVMVEEEYRIVSGGLKMIS